MLVKKHKPESFLENEKSQLLWDFEVQTDHHIEARRPDLIIVDKERNTCQIVDFAIPGDHRVEMNEGKKREISRFGKRITGSMEQESICYSNCDRGFGNSSKVFEK